MNSYTEAVQAMQSHKQSTENYLASYDQGFYDKFSERKQKYAKDLQDKVASKVRQVDFLSDAHNQLIQEGMEKGKALVEVGAEVEGSYLAAKGVQASVKAYRAGQATKTASNLADKEAFDKYEADSLPTEEEGGYDVTESTVTASQPAEAEAVTASRGGDIEMTEMTQKTEEASQVAEDIPSHFSSADVSGSKGLSSDPRGQMDEPTHNPLDDDIAEDSTKTATETTAETASEDVAEQGAKQGAKVVGEGLLEDVAGEAGGSALAAGLGLVAEVAAPVAGLALAGYGIYELFHHHKKTVPPPASVIQQQVAAAAPPAPTAGKPAGSLTSVLSSKGGGIVPSFDSVVDTQASSSAF